ncbi:hypothetical protein [Helicobacter sp. 11S02596-1]|uniref:hypothetical protein n=1 Tax=Helicobacter sp. 11S02596-1 TaxID=1476194 RepID=UPI000BA7D2A4|nr:hypothetical protein [Helicobacter sp. 11S02596-1]PAF44836.1 hypothetical protein BJI48_02290 [Helicobacter sp. 11S02596-1]
MREAYIFLSAMAVFLGIAIIAIVSLQRSGTQLDRLSNTHLKSQSLLDVRSILQMAKMCLETYGMGDCESDSFAFGVLSGGYRLELDKQGAYWADIYVERKNIRTSQILRTRLKLPLQDGKNHNKDKK